ncbi:hypothetical protein PUN28_013202 [Cardiocondyla obscurior]|uniref:Ribosomal protein S15 n=1 Tax=Cardiocondyla obscurior TaxID=286306 RepID=A0AAW2FA64_9HYME
MIRIFTGKTDEPTNSLSAERIVTQRQHTRTRTQRDPYSSLLLD